MSDEKYTPLGTPLYLDLMSAWRDWIKSNARNISVDSKADSFHIDFDLAKGIRMSYSQEQIGEGMYVENMTLVADEARIEQVVSFREDKGVLFKHVDSEKGPALMPYDHPESDIAQLIDNIDELRTAYINAGNFVKAFRSKFAQIMDMDCDRVLFMAGRDFAELGDRELLDTVRGSGDLEKGLKDAYVRHLFNKARPKTINSVEDALSYFREGERTALFTTEQHASKLLWMAGFDYDSPPENSILKINGFKIVLADCESYWNMFMDRLFCTSVYDILAGVLREKKSVLMGIISDAEELRLLNREEQMEGIRRSLEKVAGEQLIRMAPTDIRETVEISIGKQLEDVLGIASTHWFERASAEFNLHAHETMIYKEKLWWEVLKEYVGMISEGGLGMPDREEGESDDVWNGRVKRWNARQPNWAQHVAEAFTLFHDQLRMIDYDSFMYIAPERYPSDDEGRWENKRIGVGNMIVDFGDKEIFNWMDFSSPDLEAHLHRIYAEHRSEMNVSLFRGHFLQPVLKRMFKNRLPEGGTVAIAACDKREAEIAKFCRCLGDRTFAYDHEGGTVEVILLDRPLDYFNRKRKLIL